MLTEKGVKDHLWCPTLWKDEADYGKRWRSWGRGDDTLAAVHAALTTGKSNPKAVVDKGFSGIVAKPYQGDFWFVAELEDFPLLMWAREVRLEKDSSGPWVVVATRQHRKAPYDDEAREAEQMMRWALGRALREHFPGQGVRVESRYEGVFLPETSGDPDADQWQAANEWFGAIRDAAEGNVPLAANTQRCKWCKWKECPERVEDGGSRPSKPGERSGRPSRGLL